MTDREVLLMAYGALKSMSNCDVCEIIHAHLFGDKKSEPAKTPWISTEPPLPYIEPKGARGQSEQKSNAIMPEPTTPGEYRLKRSWLGEIGKQLADAKPEYLKRHIERYKVRHARGDQIHPDVALDVAAAEKYLESLK